MNPNYKYFFFGGDIFTAEGISANTELNRDGSTNPKKGVVTTKDILLPEGYKQIYLPFKLSQCVLVAFSEYGTIEYGERITESGFIQLPQYAHSIQICMNEQDVDYATILSVQECYPLYSDDVSLDIAKTGEDEFFRKTLSGQLTFISDDYKFILGQNFDAEVGFRIYSIKENKANLLYDSVFARTDCNINEDDRMVVVTPKVKDEYTEILDGMDREYNLIELKPEIEQVTLSKRPLIQMYIKGSPNISCVLGNSYWEQDCMPTTSDQELTDKYKFKTSSIIFDVSVGGNMTPDVSGNYAGIFGGKILGYDNPYQIITNAYEGQVQFIIADANGEHLFETEPSYYPNLVDQPTWIPVGSSAGVVHSGGKEYDVYTRLLCDVDSIDGEPTIDIPLDDIVPNNRNYAKVFPYKKNIVRHSVERTTDPTEWGKLPWANKYYLPPKGLNVFYPVARESWFNLSLWADTSLISASIEEKARKQYVLKDSYPLASCIDVLLKKIAPNISHEATPSYSEFLYGAHNPLSGDTFKLLISPKSNILNGLYRDPAYKAPITLAMILNMLKNVYKCYWFIEGKRLRIEHISYFENGGSYGGSPIIGTDLTKLLNPQNQKSWGFASNKYSFEKGNMPARYQFSWMDDVTKAFKGSAIDVRSNNVEKGNTKDTNVANFTTDIDLMLLNPSAFSNDGFAMMAANVIGGKNVVPITSVTTGNVEYLLQNGWLSFTDLQKKYLLYSMPADNVEIDDEQLRVSSVARNKIQEVRYPSKDLDPIRLVKTNLGNGYVSKISVNLRTLIAKATLKYETK